MTASPETSIIDYEQTLSNNPEERRRLPRSGSLKSRTTCGFDLTNFRTFIDMYNCLRLLICSRSFQYDEPSACEDEGMWQCAAPCGLWSAAGMMIGRGEPKERGRKTWPNVTSSLTSLIGSNPRLNRRLLGEKYMCIRTDRHPLLQFFKFYGALNAE
jgi:hypothetical protein